MQQVRILSRFYLLAFAISWAGFVPLLLHWQGRGWLLGLLLPGVGPAVAAWIADRRTFLAFRIAVRWTWLFLLVMYVAYDLARRRLTWLQFGIDLMSIVIAHMVIVGIHLCFGVNGSND